MKRHAFLFLLSSSALLLSCGGASSSLSSSSSSLSSSVIPHGEIQRAKATGDFQVDFAIGKEDPYQFHVDLSGVSLTVDTDAPLERLGDVLDYDYYEIANIAFELNAESIVLTAKKGRTTLIHDFETGVLEFYLMKGDFYVYLKRLDFSDLDLSPIGLEGFSFPTGKFKISDVTAELNQEKYRTLADVLSLGTIGVNSILSIAKENPAVQEALSMKRVDDEALRMDYAVSSASLAALINAVIGDTQHADVKNSIDQVMTIQEGTSFSIDYSAKTQEVSRLGFAGAVSPIIKQEQNDTYLHDLVLSFDIGTISEWVDDIRLPNVDEYEEFVLPNS